MVKAEGKRYGFLDKSHIDTKVLEALPYSGKKQVIKIETDEFSAVCPYSGLPDLGKITIEYIPNKVFVELKSVKYYFVSFRNVGIYQEEAINQIFSDFKALLKPKWLKVVLKYNRRGGIDTTCTMEE
jgi:7-cyano-7-deazaguanine reductase